MSHLAVLGPRWLPWTRPLDQATRLVVLKPDWHAEAGLAAALQDHVGRFARAVQYPR